MSSSARSPAVRVDRPEIAVNLLWCVPGRVGGSEEYLVRQLAGFSDLEEQGDTTPDLTLFCLPGFTEAHPALAERLRTVVAPIDGTSRPRRIAAEYTWLAGRTRHADLVHHGGGTMPLIGTTPTLLTVHDLQYETYPHYVTPSKLRYLQRIMPRSVARASVVAVPTEYVRSTVLDRFDVAPERVVVVPHGVEPGLGAGSPDPAELRVRYGLGDGPVVVYPAITHPHKGHRFLIDLMASTWTDPDLRLVLLGGAGAVHDDVEAAIDRLGLRSRVLRPGRVPADDRDGLISLATALAFPSEYEGFGAPAVEAMALGTPVICSDQPALREVVGDAGLVVPRDPDAWGAALERAVSDRDALVEAGRRRAERFTAATSGAALAAAYRLAANPDGDRRKIERA